MAERIPVTKDAVEGYLAKEMNGTNYHLLFGLHYLSREYFLAIMDALLNGDLAVEELTRLGDFSDESADRLLKESLQSWVSPVTSQPNAGEDGFAYLSKTLNIFYQSSESVETTITSNNILRASVKLGKNGHADIDEVARIFDTNVLPTVLKGRNLAEFLPASIDDVELFPLRNSDAARLTFLKEIYTDFINTFNLEETHVVSHIFKVGLQRSTLQKNNGFTAWVMEDINSEASFRFRFNREASERTVRGQYTIADIESKLSQLEAFKFNFIASAWNHNEARFQVKVVEAAITHHFDGDNSLKERILIVKDTLDAVFAHKERLKEFFSSTFLSCQRFMIGSFS